MGFELNRIMKQYGVSTPGMAAYSGAPVPSAPTAPTGSRPAADTGDADLTDRQQAYDKQLADFNAYTTDPFTYKMGVGAGGPNIYNFKPPVAPLGDRPAGTGAGAQAAYDKQLADFNAFKADPNALNEQMRKYGLDKKSYDEYKTNYQNRLQNTPMYSDLQFQRDQPNMSWQTGQSAPSGNTLTPEIATSLMQRSMTPVGTPTSELDPFTMQVVVAMTVHSHQHNKALTPLQTFTKCIWVETLKPVLLELQLQALDLTLYKKRNVN